MIIKIECNSETPNLMMLLEDIFLDLPNSGETWVKNGFIWNGNSSPFGTWNLIPPHKYKLASLLHDYLCDNAKNDSERKKADLDYKYILEKYYDCNVRNKIGFAGVTIGRWYWRLTGHYKKG